MSYLEQMLAGFAGALLVALVVAGVVAASRLGRRSALVVEPVPSPVERLTRERLIVTLKSGAAFEGVLWEVDDRALVLRSAVALGAAERGENLPVDGELLLFVADVAHVQKP